MALISLGAAAAPAVAQTRDQRAEFHETYNLDLGGTVSVSNVSGYIRVTSWNENRVKVDAVKRSHRGFEDLNLVEIQVNARPERVEVNTLYPRSRSSSVSVDYDIKVPRSAVLNQIKSTSGDITLTGPVARVVANSTSGSVIAQDVRGDASLTTTSGRITADRVDGTLVITTTSGELQISDVGAQLSARSTSGNIRALKVKDDATVNSTSGSIKIERAGGRVTSRAVSGWVSVNDAAGDVNAESTSDAVTIENVRGRATARSISGHIVVRSVQEGARANSTSGSIEITNVKGRIDANTISGTILLRDVDSRDVRTGSMSGGIRFQGNLYNEGRYEFTTYSGEILLLLPADCNFSLMAKSISGDIETDFPIRVGPGPIGGRHPRVVQGTHGDGGAQITVTGLSGSIRLKKQVK